MRGVDAIHRRAQALAVAQDRDVDAAGLRLVREAVHEVDLGADGPVAARRGLLDVADDGFSGAVQVGEVDDLLAALGMHEHRDAAGVRKAGAGLPDVLGPEELVNRAVPGPQEDLRAADGVPIEPAALLLRLPQRGVL